MIDKKWRVIHTKGNDYVFHYSYNPVLVGEYITSNRFEGIMVVYNWNKFNMKRGETIIENGK